MSVLRITKIGEEVLRKKAHRIKDFDQNLHSLLDDMRETMHDGNGVGLAAPQVDVSQRVIVIELPDNEDEYGERAGELFEAVNPEIIKRSRDMVDGIEGCLSIPGYVGKVDRHVAVTVRAQDRHGEEVRFKVKDWLARVFQHEIDHLDGVLYIDRASEIHEIREEPEEDELTIES